MTSVWIALLTVTLPIMAYATYRAPRLTSIIVWSLTATIFVSAALLQKAPGPFSEKALWLTLLVPVIWTGFQFWTYWDGKPWRVAGGLISMTVIGMAVILFSDPLV